MEVTVNVRTPVFELHIRPMFRATDRDHMSDAFDLWDYDAVVAQADDILGRLKSNMPPGSHGGLWPEEWIELFTRWKDGPRKRLELGAATYTFDQTATSVTIKAAGTLPAAGSKAWLQLDSETGHGEDLRPVRGTAGRPGDRYAARFQRQGALQRHGHPLRLRP
ncbi:hypothetical protein QBA75_35140 [Streptomyces stelliscabiei]